MPPHLDPDKLARMQAFLTRQTEVATETPAALQYVDHPQYHAVIFRRSYADLSLDGGLIERSKEWLGDTDARYSDKHHRWTFPSGATLSFGYIQNERDRFKYKSTEFQFLGWDELTQFRESEYTYLFSRLRKTRDNPVPLRVRAASNPGDLGHLWVKERFVLQGRRHARVFIPATLMDNPHLDVERYLESLQELDPITRAQLLEGNWDISPEGKLFLRHWFRTAPAPTLTRKVRYWDLASGTSTGSDPDYTVGCLMGITPEKTYHVLDIRRFRTTPQRQEQLIRQTAEEDGRDTPIYVEREPGSHTVHLIDHYRRNVLAGFTLKEDTKRESKEARAAPFSSMAEAGHVTLSVAPWNRDFLDELELFPTRGVHDDQADAASGALEGRGPQRRHDLRPGGLQPRETDLHRLREQLEALYAGPLNAGKILFNPYGTNITRLSSTPAEMAWQEGWSQLVDLVLAAYGVPKSVAGLQDDVNYATLYSSLKQFYLFSLNPRLQKIGNKFNKHLVRPFFGRDLCLEITAQKITDEDLLERQLQSDAQVGARTLNEWRKLRDLPPWPGPEGNQRLFASRGKPGESDLATTLAVEGAGRDGEPTRDPDQLTIARTRPTNRDGRGALGPRPKKSLVAALDHHGRFPTREARDLWESSLNGKP
jgi:predicted phage terminase large subunit-like protein